MVKRASEGLIVRYGEGAAKLEGGALTKFITVLDEYLGFLDKLNKRLREEQITELLPKLDLAKRADFEGDKKAAPKKIEKLEKELKRLQKDLKLKSVETRFDEEHNLWEVRFVNTQGAEHLINWELASTPECRQLISKFKQIERVPGAALHGGEHAEGQQEQRRSRRSAGRRGRGRRQGRSKNDGR